jgi:predicted transcriptional regulator
MLRHFKVVLPGSLTADRDRGFVGRVKATLKKSRLRSWRFGQGFSLSEVSDLTGVSQSMWSRAERGQRQFSAKTKVAIARRLGVAVAELFEPDPIDE